MSPFHDSVLEPVIEARDAAARDDAIAEVIVHRAKAVIGRVLTPYWRSGFAFSPQDADDIAASVSLRLLRKLRAVAETAEDAIERFDDYVATLTFNAAYDFFRRRYPKRARLKNRLRYVLTHDHRLAMWGAPETIVAGLSAWRGRRDVADSAAVERRSATASMLDEEHPADAVAAVFAILRAPLQFDDLVRLMAELWRVVDLREAPLMPRAVPPTQLVSVESKETLRLVWREIRDLPVPQRCALLLNLRDGEKGNAVALLVIADVATLAEITQALEMSAADLAAMWGRLPLDDLTIAERLGLTRQQVINLRKSARARLARRIASAR